MVSKKEKQKRQIKKDALAEICKFVLDIAKLIFGGVILSGIMGLSFDKVTLCVVGGLVICALLIMWYILFTLSKRKD